MQIDTEVDTGAHRISSREFQMQTSCFAPLPPPSGGTEEAEAKGQLKGRGGWEACQGPPCEGQGAWAWRGRGRGGEGREGGGRGRGGGARGDEGGRGEGEGRGEKEHRGGLLCSAPTGVVLRHAHRGSPADPCLAGRRVLGSRSRRRPLFT